LFWYMVMISVSLYFPFPARVTLHEVSEWARLPSAKECIYGGSVADGNRNPEGGVAEAERRRAAGRRIAPKRDPEQRTGYEADGTHWTVSPDCLSAAEARPNRSPRVLAKAPTGDRFSLPSRLPAGALKMLRGRWGCTAGLAACGCIG
jgi:hypothetical protein